MKINSQTGFIPLIIAIIAALSLGGGVWAYKAQEHKKEVKIQQEMKLEEGSQELDKKITNEEKTFQKEEKKSSRSENDENEQDDDEEEEDDDNVIVRNPPVLPPVVGGTVKSYTLADVKLHNTNTNCWTAVMGSVYDVTSWISAHPGGSGAIIGMCGVDASGAYNGQHGGQSRPTSELASFKIGLLK